MFASSRDADQAYDFDSEENATKWRNLLINSLLKVQFQVHPSLNAKDDALRYVETLIFRLLGMLCAAQPHTVQDVEERVQKTFPHPIDKWAIGDAQSAIEKGKKKSPLVLPVEKIHPLLQKEILGYKVDLQVTQYIVAVLEYISADILKLAGNYVKNIRHVEITCQDIKVAMCADKVLMDMFYQDEDVSLSIEEEPTRRTSLTYDEVVKDLIHEEKQYIRDLNMIIKVFREPFVPIFHKKELDVIFSNILEIYDFSVSLLGTFEDALEMAEENQYPSIGACYEELAEYQEFDVYDKYAHDILNSDNKEKMMTLIQQPNIRQSLQFAGHGFTQAVKYVLPKLLLGPVFHCFQYFDFLKVLKKLSPCPEDQESLTQAEGVFSVLKTELERLCSSILPKRKQGEQFSRMYAKGNRQASIQRMNDLQRSIDGWEGKDIGQCCNDFVMDGILGKVGSGGRRLTERQVFLFDGLMVLCKPNNKRSSVTGPVAEFRLKEKYYLRKIEIIDKDDTDELKNAFEIAPRDQLHIVLFTKTAEEKSNWMAHLIMLNTKSMLERTLDSILLDEEKKHPLRLPTVDKYKFAVEDSESNIIFEENKSKAGVPIIKGATLTKLVERLTYHMYADPMFVRTFLTTYRSFCQPLELLDLLIERYPFCVLL
ncbi:hypothetical protein JTE90_006830 [Oedothorax gibbosus]|uniref:Uncharacterized protein n=1 Tax=Oedothorax gibbosus TaxID=931172 RepID=A0AAV6TW23_9ARAC|nr:hypothetical protein JTE90_006830 [Oedothorax gibbosus]